MNYALMQEQLKNMHSHYTHPSYQLELRLLREIKLGLYTHAKETLNRLYTFDPAKSSPTSIRSIKNQLIGASTLYSRAIIETGVPVEIAFNLNDVFVQKVESLVTVKELESFNYTMVEESIHCMRQHILLQYSYIVSKTIQYIYDNITLKLSVSDIAYQLNISADYLSSLFNKEVGQPLSSYINQHKIEVAKNFLAYTSLRITEISTLLEYCNSAYFSNVFKKYTNQSPLDYRNSLIHQKDIGPSGNLN